MSVNFDVAAVPRSDTGKGASRRLRRQGLVPAIVYGGHQDPLMVSLRHNEVLRHLEHESFYSHVLNLKVGEDSSATVVLKDLQRHPAKPFILHVDFMRVSQDEKLRMVVPLHFLNAENVPRHQGRRQCLPRHDRRGDHLPAEGPARVHRDRSVRDGGRRYHPPVRSAAARRGQPWPMSWTRMRRWSSCTVPMPGPIPTPRKARAPDRRASSRQPGVVSHSRVTLSPPAVIPAGRRISVPWTVTLSPDAPASEYRNRP